MLPNNSFPVSTMRVVTQSVVPRDITDEFTSAASSEPLPLYSPPFDYSTIQIE